MSRAYYNEHDAQKAEWLRTLILFGLIAPGDVDERDIRDVTPNDLRGYEQHHFFAGIVQDDVQVFFMTGAFDLDIDSTHGNCDLCLMLATWKIKERMLLFALAEQIKPRRGGAVPTRVARWIAWEERVSDRPGTFRKDRPTIRQLWEEICDGNLTAVGNGRLGLTCLSCTD